jgi:serine/threonine protein kinase/tetratricopeptide (TPR) repeat protein
MVSIRPANNLIGSRYQLGEQLGQGGMGTVFQAVDRLTGKKVALKRVVTLSDHQPSDSESDGTTFRLALAREFKVLASLRHPHIISVLDYGFDDERQPYVIMELLEDAQDFLEASRPQPLDQQIDLLIQLLQALAYLHRRGILHRDLKPSNVLIAAQKHLKVLDFGLAIADLEQAKDGVTAGTLAYLAPEVLQGEHASQRTDLYAVGVMAYELFTGRHPFDVNNTGQLVRDILQRTPDLMALNQSLPKHIDPATTAETEPAIYDYDLFDSDTIVGVKVDDLSDMTNAVVEPPDEASGDLNRFAGTDQPLSTAEGDQTYNPIVTIVGKLLAKRPEDRYRDSYDVIADFVRASNRPLPEESPAIRESYLQAAAFVGRDEQLGQLEEALAAAVQGKGSAWLVGGESGIGKSRLLEELRIQALVKGVTVLRGQAVANGGLPYQLWREPLRRLILTTPMKDIDASILKDLVPDIDDLLGSRVEDAVALEGSAYQQRLLGAIANLFRDQTHPILLLLEDLHWSYESLDVVRILSGMVRELPLLIVGSYRHEERPDLPNDLADMQLLRLERLTADDIGHLSASMLGEVGRQPEVLTLLQRETEGNVFFLVEVVRALAEEAGRLEDVGRTHLPQRVIAGGVQAIVQRRLERVPSNGQRLLQLAAVSGRDIDLRILRQFVSGNDALDIDEWLTTCLNYAVFEIHDGQWRFAHDKLREATLSAIPPAIRPQLHQQVAEAIERTYPNSPEHAAILAQHWRQAEVVEKEFVSARRAGKYALTISSLSDAIAHFERAIELLPLISISGTSRRQAESDLLINLGEALQYLGDYKTALERIEAGLQICYDNDDQAGAARALSLRGDIEWRRGEYASALQACEDSLRLAEMLDDRHRIAQIMNRIGMIAFDQGDYPRAVEFIEKSLTLSEAIGNHTTRATATNNLGLVALRQGNLADATRYFEENLVLSRSNGERWKVASTLTNLGTAAGIQGNLPQAIEYFKEALEMCRSIGDRRGAGAGQPGLCGAASG